jgi:hypothetical protein
MCVSLEMKANIESVNKADAQIARNCQSGQGEASGSKERSMKTKDDDANVTMQTGSPLSRFTWLVAGVGIGAVAGILLAPQSGENTREWISTRCKNGIENVNSKVRQTSQSVGDWIDQGQREVSEAVSAGRDAFRKAKAGTT